MDDFVSFRIGLSGAGVKMVSFMDLLTGRFGDERRAKGGGLLAGRLVEQQSPIVRRLGRDRAGTVAFGRFLANQSVMLEEIFADAGFVLVTRALKPSHTDRINSKL